MNALQRSLRHLTEDVPFGARLAVHDRAFSYLEGQLLAVDQRCRGEPRAYPIGRHPFGSLRHGGLRESPAERVGLLAFSTLGGNGTGDVITAVD